MVPHLTPPPPPPPAQPSAPQRFEISLPQLDALQAKLDAILEGRGVQTWYTLEQAWRLKFAGRAGEEGAISLQSIKNELAFQPRGGLPDTWQSNRKVWLEATIEAWLLVDDAGLAAYLKVTNPRRRIPDRIRDGLKKRVVV
jgi:hypothetical protein